jgi:MoxR-like ATPase
LAAKARALLHGRTHASEDDIQAVASPVLRHRILVNFNAEADGVGSLDIVRRLLDTVTVPHHSQTRPA